MRAARVVCWGFDLGEDRGFDILWQHFNPRCQPEWSESELAKKCRDAMDSASADKPRGWLRDTETEATSQPRRRTRTDSPSTPMPHVSGAASTGSTSESTASSGPGSPTPPVETPPSPIGVDDEDPYHLANRYLDRFRHPDGYLLRFWSGDFCLWCDGAYDRLADEEVRGSVTQFVECEFRRKHESAMRTHSANRERGSDEKPPRKKKVTRAIVSDVLQALQSIIRIPGSAVPPCWLGEGPPASELISARNGILHLPQFVAGEPGAFTRPTPRFFTFNRVAFDFEDDAPEPRAWLQFLGGLWPNDPDSIDCLQEWFGYLLTPDTSLQKMLLIIGPTRAGKGTISKIVKELVGESNIAAPTLGRLAGDFGPQDLLNKPVAIIADARLSGRTDTAAIVEELLSVSGEDLRTIPRKHQSSITCKLPTRFVFLSNEFPALGDTSGAILGRFVVLRLTESFLGREDNELFDRLKTELPGILLWAIEGWQRIQETRRFTEPESGLTFREDARAVLSPITLFVDQWCELGDPEFFTETADLYEAWVRWSKQHGRERIESREKFVIRLRSVVASIKPKRARSGLSRTQGYEGIRLLSEFETGTGRVPD